MPNQKRKRQNASKSVAKTKAKRMKPVRMMTESEEGSSSPQESSQQSSSEPEPRPLLVSLPPPPQLPMPCDCSEKHFSITSYFKGVEIMQHFESWALLLHQRMKSRSDIQYNIPKIKSLEREADNARLMALSFPDSDKCDMSSFNASFELRSAKSAIKDAETFLSASNSKLRTQFIQLTEDWTVILSDPLKFVMHPSCIRLVSEYTQDSIDE